MGVARDSLPYICEDRPKPGWLGFKYNLADKIIFSKIKSALGMDKMVAAISGGGPLSVADAEFILGLGIKAVEGYGLTETTPVIAANRPKRIKPGTVGPAVKDTHHKDRRRTGKILVKPADKKGYSRNPRHHGGLHEDGFFPRAT
jgi:long-chain acyl-CoA synthetase